MENKRGILDLFRHPCHSWLVANTINIRNREEESLRGQKQIMEHVKNEIAEGIGKK